MKPRTEDQLSFSFENPQGCIDSSGRVLSMPDADVVFYQDIFQKDESDKIFEELIENIKWAQDKIKYYGKEVDLPRLTAWYGNRGTTYTYSHISMHPHAWTSTLLYMKNKIEKIARADFNSVLLNLYRNGKDGVSWHQDNEPELGSNPVIASVSFGETRRFQLKHRFKKDLPKVEVDLTHGSLLIMKGGTQQFWQHQIPKTSKQIHPRINLTFRVIQPLGR